MQCPDYVLPCFGPRWGPQPPPTQEPRRGSCVGIGCSLHGAKKKRHFATAGLAWPR